MNTFPTRIKDLDLKILMELDDRSLFKACSTDTYTKRICDDENFWRNRFVNKFGTDTIQFKPENKSWRNYYLQVVIDLDRYKNNPRGFLDRIVWKTNINDSYFRDYEQNLYPLNKAPRWVLNNLYLLNLGDIEISIREFEWGADDENVIVQKATPYKLFKYINSNIDLASYEYIDGIGSNYLSYSYPMIITEHELRHKTRSFFK